MLTQWFRIGFRDTTPVPETVVEVGVNDTSKQKMFFLAPVNDEGQTLMTQMRSVPADADGYPNGYFPTVTRAKEAVANQLQSQIGEMNKALNAVTAVVDPAAGQVPDTPDDGEDPTTIPIR